MCDGVVRWGVDFIVAGMVGVGVAADFAGADTEPCAAAADLLLRIVESADTDLQLVEALLDSVERCGGLDTAAVVRWGFTPITMSLADFANFDVSALDYTLVQCFDGRDNDGDGLVDFPYDPGCECAADDSE